MRGERFVAFRLNRPSGVLMVSFPNLRINRVSYVLEKQEDKQRYYRLVRMETTFLSTYLESEKRTAVELADTVESFDLDLF